MFGSMPARSAQAPCSARQETPRRHVSSERSCVSYEVADSGQFEEQPAGIQRRPAAIWARRQVRNEHMAVKVGVRCATGPVKKSRGRKAACRQRRRRLAAGQAAPDAGATSLQVLERGRGGFLVPGAYLRSDLLGT